MNLKIRTFDELTNRQLYEILRLRAEVFIVEQEGCYLDPDGVDCESIHIFSEEADGSVSGCVRIFPKEDEPGTVQVGRLVCRNRMTGMGRRLMEQAERSAVEVYDASALYLTGRKSAEGFYLRCGYRIEADWVTYDEFRKDLR